MERLNDAKSQASLFRKFPPRILLLLLVISLPLVNPWVRGDGVGYYAFARAPLIQHNLDFTADYQHANQGFAKPASTQRAIPRTFSALPPAISTTISPLGPR